MRPHPATAALCLSLLGNACLDTDGVESSGLAFEGSDCFFDESGIPTMRCPDGSVEVRFDPIDVAPAPVFSAEELTGMPGCSLECLIDECPDCPPLVTETLAASDLPAAGPGGTLVFRDVRGAEIERMPIGQTPVRDPVSERARVLLEAAGAAALQYEADELGAGPVALTTSPDPAAPTGPAAGGIRAVLPGCQGVKVRAEVQRQDGAESSQWIAETEPGPVQPLEPPMQRLLGYIAYRAGALIASWREAQCPQQGGAPPVLAMAGNNPLGPALAVFVVTAPRLIPRLPAGGAWIQSQLAWASRIGTDGRFMRWIDMGGRLTRTPQGHQLVISETKLVAEVAERGARGVGSSNITLEGAERIWAGLPTNETRLEMLWRLALDTRHLATEIEVVNATGKIGRIQWIPEGLKLVAGVEEKLLTTPSVFR